MQLFALAYAGGTATTVYGDLRTRLSPLAEVVPLDLPGRGHDATRRPRSVGALIDRLWETVRGQALRDWALLGHSFGAALAFELARRAEAEGRAPRVCFISGRRAPAGGARVPGPALTDDELFARVAQWGALPREFQTHPALREMAASRLRDDVAFSDELHARDPAPLDRTILHTLAGEDDPVASPEQVHAWRGRTNLVSTAQTFEGDHFFLLTNPAAYDAIADRLRQVAPIQSMKGTS